MRILPLLALLLFPLSLLGDDQPAARPDIDQLLEVSNAEKNYASAIQRLNATLEQSFHRQGEVSGQNARLMEAQQRAVKAVEADITWEKLKPLYEKVYADVYTPDDVKGILAFYNSPAGKAFLAKEPLLIQKTMQMQRDVAAGVTDDPATLFGSAAPVRPDIVDLLKTGRVKENYDVALEQMKAMREKMIKQYSSGGDDGEAQAKKMNAQFDARMAAYDWDRMKDKVAAVYGEVFTPEEAQGMIAFYNSPAGKVYLEKKPLLVQKTAAIIPQLMASLVPKLQAAIQNEESNSGPASSGT